MCEGEKSNKIASNEDRNSIKFSFDKLLEVVPMVMFQKSRCLFQLAVERIMSFFDHLPVWNINFCTNICQSYEMPWNPQIHLWAFYNYLQ